MEYGAHVLNKNPTPSSRKAKQVDEQFVLVKSFPLINLSPSALPTQKNLNSKKGGLCLSS